MNNTEYDLLTKEKLFEMYEDVCSQLDNAETQLYNHEYEIDELEAEVEYWRGLYEDKGTNE